MLDSNYFISRTCHIDSNGVSVDEQLFYPASTTDFATFAKAVYYQIGTNYNKFFKMDHLSKLAWLGAELILKDEQSKDIALVFSNKSSSLETDLKHQKSIENEHAYYPSPSVFVYTLPNVCIGEVSIRHQLLTENIFFIADTFDPTLMETYTNYLLQEGRAEKVLCGWVEFINENYQLVLYLVEKTGSVPHNNTNIKELFT